MAQTKLVPWYQFSLDELQKHVHTEFAQGLTHAEIAKRQKRSGRNRLKRHAQQTLLSTLLGQMKNPLAFILLIAGILTIVLGQTADAVVIFLALVINIGVGVYQEQRASKAFETLVASQEKTATVIRQGEKRVVSSEDLVVGDLVELHAGMYVPADVRILEEKELTTNESALTGEWVEVSKEAHPIEKDTPISEQNNMAWMGTLVTGGSARAVVVGIGEHTQIGLIAKELALNEEGATPLQKSINKLARSLVYMILGILIVIFAIGFYHQSISIEDLVLISIAVAVAAMPQGLPAAVTVVLAIGMEKILAKKGLVRNLLAAETLGRTTVILTDKTGTLTKAEMRVAQIVTPASLDARENQQELPQTTLAASKDDIAVLEMGMLASNAFVEGEGDTLSDWIVQGRPVERAIVLAGLESGMREQALLASTPRVDFLPFESERRFAASLHATKTGKKYRMYVSGSPEVLIEHGGYALYEGRARTMTAPLRTRLLQELEKINENGLRTIAIGYKDILDAHIPQEDDPAGVKTTSLEKSVFCGLIVLHDPLRADVPEAIKTAKAAGTRVIMLTGDNPVTAARIAIQAGIAKKGERTYIGSDIEKMTDDELFEALRQHHVFARVLPYQKLRISRLLKAHGEVVAMTGDGINDAPALRDANIGLALGSGTEVAKEAADLILLDNNFAVIVRAIEEGRRMHDNLKKIVAYLLSTSFSEVIVVGAALVSGMTIPLLPTQILWTNMIEEGFMNFAFAFEPAEDDIMERDPRDDRMKDILTPRLRNLIIIIAATSGILLVALYAFLLYTGTTPEELRTLMFIGVSIDSIFFAFSIKNLAKPIWKINIFSNQYLIISLILSFLLLIAALTIPALEQLLSLAPPSSETFTVLIGFGLANVLVIECAKYIVFRWHRRAARDDRQVKSTRTRVREA